MPEDREQLRSTLVARARADERIVSGAITGSASVGREDRWSDIDLAFGVADHVPVSEVLADFSRDMYQNHDALHHVDVVFGPTIYRVFLLRNTLQVDLAFSPTEDFRAVGPTFQLLFGNQPQQVSIPRPPLEHWVGWAWLYALHARSCIRRSQWWRAEYMISGMRDTILTLACARLDLPIDQARAFDQLPRTITDPLEQALVRELHASAVIRSFAATMDAFLRELGALDMALKERLEGSLTALVDGLSKTPDR